MHSVSSLSFLSFVSSHPPTPPPRNHSLSVYHIRTHALQVAHPNSFMNSWRKTTDNDNININNNNKQFPGCPGKVSWNQCCRLDTSPHDPRLAWISSPPSYLDITQKRVKQTPHDPPLSQTCLPQISYLDTPVTKMVYFPQKWCTFQILFVHMGSHYYS